MQANNHKMTPAESGIALIASAQAVRACVQALVDGRLAPPPAKTLKSGYKRFAPHFDRSRRTRYPYTLAWLAKTIGSEYPSHKGQPTPWIIAGLQFNINLERGTWASAEIEKASRGEKGYTCHALCLQYRKEARARLTYIKRDRKRDREELKAVHILKHSSAPRRRATFLLRTPVTTDAKQV